MSRRKQTIEQDRKIDSEVAASEEQYLQIEKLINENRSLAKQINQLPAMLLTVISIPLMMKLLFLGQRSPLRGVYDQLYQIASQDESIITQKTLDHAFKIRVQPYIDSYDQLVKLFEKLQLAFFDSFGKRISMNETMEHYAHENPYGANIAVTNLRSIILSVPTALVKISDLEVKKINSTIMSYNLSTLFKVANDTIQYFVPKMILPVMKGAHDLTVAQLAPISVNRWLLSIEVPLAMLIQTQGFNRLFAWQAPAGLLMKAPPQRKVKTWLSQADADDYAQELMEHRNILKKRAKVSNIISTVLFLLFIPISLTIFQFEQPSAELVYIGISLLGAALPTMKNFLIDTYNNQYFSRAMAYKNNLFSKLADSKLPILIESHAGDSLEQSYFELQFTQFKALRNTTCTRLFIKVLRERRIEISLYGDRQVFIHSNQFKNSAAVDAIINDYQRNLERELNIKKLREQIFDLVKFCRREDFFYCRSYTDIEKLAVLEFNIRFSPRQEWILPILKSHLSVENFTITNNPQGDFVVSFNGHQPLRAAIKSTIMAELAPISATSVTETISIPEPRKGQRKRAESKEERAEQKSEVKVIAEPTRGRLDWPSASYDFNSDDNEVYPMATHGIYDEKSHQKTMHFSLLRLTEEDFPNQELFKKAQRITTVEAKLVPHSGYQGILFASGYQRNRDGEWHEVSAKGKFLGLKGKGDIRIFSHSEVASDGSELHIFDTVRFKAHKRSK